MTLLRFANVLGNDIDTPFAQALRRPVAPEILGFDPRVQFVHEDDVVGALMYATNNDVPGVLQRRRRRQPPVERGVRDRRPAAGRAPAGAHRMGRGADADRSASGTSRPRR